MLLGKIPGTSECSRLHSDMFMDVSAPAQAIVAIGGFADSVSGVCPDKSTAGL